MVEITVFVVLALLFAALVATLLRFWDFPLNTIGDVELKTGVATFVGALIAAFLAMWLGNLDPTIASEFVVVTTAAVGGMAGIRGLFEAGKVVAGGEPTA
jgi:hypothetical protein